MATTCLTSCHQKGRSLDQWHQHHLKSVKEAGLESAFRQDSRVNVPPGTLRLRSYSRQALTKFRLQGADHWHRGVRADQLPSSHFMKTVFSSVPVLLSLKGHDFSAVLFPFKASAVRISWCHLCRHRRGAEQQLLIHTQPWRVDNHSQLGHTLGNVHHKLKNDFRGQRSFLQPSTPPFGSRLTFSLRKLFQLSDYED